MEAFIIQNLAPIMFASLIVVLLLGYPAAFSLAFVGLFYALVGIGLGQFHGIDFAADHAALRL